MDIKITTRRRKNLQFIRHHLHTNIFFTGFSVLCFILVLFCLFQLDNASNFSTNFEGVVVCMESMTVQ